MSASLMGVRFFSAALQRSVCFCWFATCLDSSACVYVDRNKAGSEVLHRNRSGEERLAVSQRNLFPSSWAFRPAWSSNSL